MMSRNAFLASRQLVASGANVRIMLAAQEDAMRELARIELRHVGEAPLRQTLAIIELLTLHCSTKARQVAVER